MFFIINTINYKCACILVIILRLNLTLKSVLKFPKKNITSSLICFNI